MAGALMKSRRVRFELTLRILDLNNVPLVSGSSFVKWHLPTSTAAEHRGRTNRCTIREHRVEYEYEKQVTTRMTVGKDGTLQEFPVDFEVVQEYSAGGRAERIRLGEVKLNLAEYVEASEAQNPASPSVPGAGGDAEEGIVRRYLMRDSKINSTLKIGIHMRYLEGTRDYHAPPLKTAPVFGGIAGIISTSESASTTHGVASQDINAVRDAAEGTSMPNLSRANRELGEMQDIYRRTLAAHLFSMPGELKADEAIEDIFAGGNGWGKAGRPPPVAKPANGTPHTSSSEMATPRNTHDLEPPGPKVDSDNRYGHRKSRSMKANRGEIDEFVAREDLRSWRTMETAS